MTIPSSGAFGISNVNTEVGRTSTSANSLNDPSTRLLTCNTTQFGASGVPLAMSELRGRAGGGFNVYMKDQTPSGGSNGPIGGVPGDGVNASPLGTIPGGITVREITCNQSQAFLPSIKWQRVRLNCGLPYDRFFAMGIWDGANYLGAFKMADRQLEEDGTSSGFIGVSWRHDAFLGPDLRPYVNRTLTYVFVV